MGFELLKDSGGHAFVRAFYTAQSMDQLRELQPLTPAIRRPFRTSRSRAAA
jgi:hypothetical protein